MLDSFEFLYDVLELFPELFRTRWNLFRFFYFHSKRKELKRRRGIHKNESFLLPMEEQKNFTVSTVLSFVLHSENIQMRQFSLVSFLFSVNIQMINH